MLQLEFSPQQKCIDLLRADTEEQVINLLSQYGYWDDPNVWRPFGDKEDNFSTIGNQSANPEAALVEKLVNSVDAVLMGECWAAGMRPNSPDAPRSIPEAVAMFIHNDASKANTLGHVSYWSDQKRREVADRITLAATGARSNPSITIVDSGEGQSPALMPGTLLSLDKKNKIDIHFVQGKFNMGGTGALRFCGDHNLQLIISRRNPSLKSDGDIDSSHGQWGFTIVRRENPTDEKRVSTYTYLAPQDRGVLRFNADALPLFPTSNRAYIRDTEWGTAIKLYEYRLTGRSNILRGDGLLQRLDLLLPKAALPIRFHECRDYKGHTGSFDTTLTGLSVRLSDDRTENLEPGYPSSSTITISEQKMSIAVYAFKRGKADSYRGREGVIFTVNGQTHGNISKAFFSRTSVGMNRLEDSLLVVVDCSRISGRRKEDLFMNSRDRMEQGEFLKAIKNALASILKSDPDLRALSAQRQSEDLESKLKDSKPFEEVLRSILQKSPSLAALFGGTGRLPNPFKPDTVKTGKEFRPKLHPSYFRFQNKNYGHVLELTTPINMRSRIAFETDVAKDYFEREQYAGEHVLRPLLNFSIPDHTLNMHSGTATLNLDIPKGARIGDSFEYEFTVRDDTLVEPFVNRFKITTGQPQDSTGGNGKPRHRFSDGQGNEETPKGLALPTRVPVYESAWDIHDFDKYSALQVVHNQSDKEEDSGSYTYYINMDNIHLKTELKATKESPEIIKARWQFGLVLIGMALLKDNAASSTASTNGQFTDDDEEVSAEERVGSAAKSIAPVLLPLIEHLGALSEEDVRN